MCYSVGKDHVMEVSDTLLSDAPWKTMKCSYTELESKSNI